MPIVVVFGDSHYKRYKKVSSEVCTSLRLLKNASINGFWHVTIKDKNTKKFKEIPKIDIYKPVIIGNVNSCFYCENKVKKGSITKDHFYPKSKGGLLTVYCCFRCNQFKKDYTPEVWLTVLNSIYKKTVALKVFNNVKTLCERIDYPL